MCAQSFPLLDSLLAAGAVWHSPGGRSMGTGAAQIRPGQGSEEAGPAEVGPEQRGPAEVSPERPGPRAWGLAELGGHVVELVGGRASALTTTAAMLTREAQSMGEPVAWLVTGGWTFYPPDLAACGIDLDALAIVVLPDAKAAWRAVDRLVRSGAFGLVVVDGGAGSEEQGRAPAARRSARSIPLGVQARLVGLAKRYATTIVWLTRGVRSTQDETGRVAGKAGSAVGSVAESPAQVLGSFAAVRVQCERRRVDDGVFECVLSILKDKRKGSSGPGARHGFVCDGTLGLR